MYSVVNKRRGKVVKEDLIEEAQLLLLLPMFRSLRVSTSVRSSGSRQVAWQCLNLYFHTGRFWILIQGGCRAPRRSFSTLARRRTAPTPPSSTSTTSERGRVSVSTRRSSSLRRSRGR